MSDLIEIGKIVGVHGVKGCVKINATLQDATLFKSLRPISDENGHVFELTQVVVSNGQVRAMIEGVSCREEAKKLIGTVLFVPKTALPKIPADEFYYHDLVGLAVFENQTEIGVISNVFNYGAGDIIEVDTGAKKELFAFNVDSFSAPDFENHRIYLTRGELA